MREVRARSREGGYLVEPQSFVDQRNTPSQASQLDASNISCVK